MLQTSDGRYGVGVLLKGEGSHSRNFRLIHIRVSDVNEIRPVGHVQSESFYSSKFGYKFCLRMAVSHGQVSLFVHLMRGENDEFLPFPFHGVICFTLLDVSTSGEMV